MDLLDDLDAENVTPGFLRSELTRWVDGEPLRATKPPCKWWEIKQAPRAHRAIGGRAQPTFNLTLTEVRRSRSVPAPGAVPHVPVAQRACRSPPSKHHARRRRWTTTSPPSRARYAALRPKTPSRPTVRAPGRAPPREETAARSGPRPRLPRPAPTTSRPRPSPRATFPRDRARSESTSNRRHNQSTHRTIPSSTRSTRSPTPRDLRCRVPLLVLALRLRLRL